MQRIAHEVPGPKSGLLDGFVCSSIISAVAMLPPRLQGKDPPKSGWTEWQKSCEDLAQG